jgi:hypothetical protein
MIRDIGQHDLSVRSVSLDDLTPAAIGDVLTSLAARIILVDTAGADTIGRKVDFP